MTVKIYEKKGYWYARIQYYDEEGNQHQVWRATGFPVKNNKGAAKAKAEEIKKEFEERLKMKDAEKLFSDWLLEWLELTKHSIKESTYSTYKRQIKNNIVPYFKEHPVKLCDLTPQDLQAFYNYKIDHDNVKAATVHRYHANIHKALAYAVKTINNYNVNPADNVELPKEDKYISDFYSKSELETLLKGCVGSPIEIPVKLAAWFGLRRGECIGLRWSCVNFEEKTMFVHGVIKDKGKGTQKRRDLYYDDNPKRVASIRTLAIPDFALDYLKDLKAVQERRQQFPNYNKEFTDYVCVRENGDLISLERVTRDFPELCKKCGLRKIRFHELRHSNVSLLLSNGMNMKAIQQIAGHSDIRTTMNTYAHLQAVDRQSASIMQNLFGSSKVEQGVEQR